MAFGTQNEESTQCTNLFSSLASLLIVEWEWRSGSLLSTTAVANKGIAIGFEGVRLRLIFGVSGHLDDVVLNTTTQKDVNTTSCHVGGNGDLTLSACFRNDKSFLLVELCIQDVMRNTVHQRLFQIDLVGFR